MRKRARRALIALGLVGSLAGLMAAQGLAARNDPPRAVISIPWPGGTDDPGGWSGIEVSDDGSRFWAISDSGYRAEGVLVRAPSGSLADARLVATGPLRAPDGSPLERPWNDTEGLARAPDGSFLVSREWLHGVSRYSNLDSPADRLAAPPAFRSFRDNTGLEAIAIDPQGRAVTLRERPPWFDQTTQLHRQSRRGWQDTIALDRKGLWSAVGADFGPDGRFYLLERRFVGLGFASRLRVFDLDEPARPLRGTVLYRSPLGRHGNLEGLAIWQDDEGGLRALMVSDDNAMRFQRGEIVELRLAPPGPGA